jgi:hypothetical protein
MLFALHIPAIQRSVPSHFISVLPSTSSVALRLMTRHHWAPPVHVDRTCFDRYSPHIQETHETTQYHAAVQRSQILQLADLTVLTVGQIAPMALHSETRCDTRLSLELSLEQDPLE